MLTRHVAVAVVVVAVVSLTETEPATAQSRQVIGVTTVLVGAGLMAGAFDYRGDVCPAGYSTHRYQNLPTQCVFVSNRPPYNSDVQEATTKVRLKRRGMLWSGLGAVGVGVVLFMLPGDAGQAVSRTVDIRVAPDRVQFGKTFGF